MKRCLLNKIIKTSAVLLLAAFSFSCQLFDNDVNDFMEKYTETAGIEEHELSEQTYLDAYGHTCINSKKDLEVTLYMRNPKRFEMIPSVDFSNLDPEISRSEIQIQQTSSDSLHLTIPQSFLIAADEGKNITGSFTLYEPMSGRIFVGYDIPLYCNTVPPKVEVPTIINNNGQNFVIAFDMPAPEELALRHKDIASVTINNTDYPISINEDGSFTIDNPRFTREPETSFVFINDKDFTQTTNSVYFQTTDPFIQGDKSYTIGLKDSAGLMETVFTSTSISRLSRPSSVDIDGFVYPNNSNEMVSGSLTEPFQITLNPPTTDHKGNTVADTTLHYTVYKGTSMVATVFREGTTNQAETLSLEPGTYFIEAYATKTNYEQSAVYRLTFRIVDNAIFVSENGSDITGDGTRELPFQTLSKAMEDVDIRNMPSANVTIYLDGTLRGATNISAAQTRSITLTKKTGGADVVIDAQSAGTALNITTSVPVILRNMTITGGNGVNGGAIKIAGGADVRLHSDVTITGNTATGKGGAIYADTSATLNIGSGVTISSNHAGSDGGAFYFGNSTEVTIDSSISITNNTSGGDGGAVYIGNSANVTFTESATLTGNTASGSGGAVYIGNSSTVNFDSSAVITGNTATGNGGAVYIGNSSTIVNFKSTASLTGNNATGSGGAVYIGNSSTANFTSTATLTDNTAGSDGGAVCIGSNSTVNITSTATLKDNTAGGDGGAVYIGNNSTVNFNSSATLTSNTSGGNGGAVCTGSTATVAYASAATITGNTATGSGGAVYIGNGTNVTFVNGTTITGNTANVNGGGVYDAGNITISGVINISSNTNNSGERSNLYLATGKKLKIVGALSAGSNNSSIGVSSQSTPSALTAVTVTDGYGYNSGYNSGVNPGTFFIGDAYAINKDETTGEVGLYLDSGTFDDLLSTLNISFAIEGGKNSFTVGTAEVFNIIPTVTVMNGSTPITIDYSDIQDKIVWTIKLKNGGVDVAGVTSSTNSITIPSTVTIPDSYKLYVKAVYDGLYTFDREFDISGHN